MQKRLYRSNTSKIIGGVCGGLGEYFEVDPVLVRIITVLLALATGGMGVVLLAYVIAWIIMPKRPWETESTTSKPTPQYSSWSKYLPGLILLAIGTVLLIRENWYWFDWGEFWPVILIAAGLALIFRRNRTHDSHEVPSPGHNNHNPDAQNGGTVS